MRNKIHNIRLSFLVFGVILTMLFAGIAQCGTVFAEEAGNEGFSLKITGSVDGGGSFVNSMIQSGDIEFEAAPVEDGVLANAVVKLGENELASLLVKIDQENVYFQIPQAGEEVYQMSLEKLMEYVGSLSSNPFLSGGSDSVNMVPDITEEEVMEALNPILNLLSEHLQEALRMETDAEAQLTGLGTTVPGCAVYIYQPDEEQLASFLNALAENIGENEALDNLAGKLADYIRSLDSYISAASYTGGTEELSAEEIAQNVENTYAQLPQLISENGEAIAQTLAESGFTVRVAVTEDGVPVLVEILMNADGSEFRAAYEMTVDDDALSFYQGLYIDEELFALTGTVNGSETVVSGDIVLRTEGMTVAELTFDIDTARTSGSGIPYGAAALDLMGVHISGELKEGEAAGTDALYLDVTGIGEFTKTSYDDEDPIDGVHLVIETGTEADPAAPEGTIVDVTDYSPEQWQELLAQIGERLSSSMG